MKKTTLIIILGAVLTTAQLHAGDLIVNGKIGVGTSSPSASVHIVTGANLGSGHRQIAILGNGYADWTSFGSPQGGRIRGASEGYLVLDSYPTGADNRLFLNYGSPGDVIIANGGGNVGIGTGTPATKLYIGDAGGSAVTAFTGYEYYPNVYNKNTRTDEFGTGLMGESSAGRGVVGVTQTGIGVYGTAINGSGIGVGGKSSSGTGVYGYSQSGEGGYFSSGEGKAGYFYSESGTAGYFFSANHIAGQFISFSPNEAAAYFYADSGPGLIVGSGNVGIGTSDPGADRLDVRGRAYASGGWHTTNADYAEWFEKEEDTVRGDIIGINYETGKVRKYRIGDKFLGVHAANPAIVGNRFRESDEEMLETHTPVSLMGQVEIDLSQVRVRGRLIETQDGKDIGVMLSNGRIFIGR